MRSRRTRKSPFLWDWSSRSWVIAGCAATLCSAAHAQPGVAPAVETSASPPADSADGVATSEGTLEDPSAQTSGPLEELPATAAQPPTGIEEELEFIRPGVAIKRKFDEIAEKKNLRIGLANTLLFQQASAGPGNRSAASGDLDFLAKWTAVGAGTKDTGILAFSAEYRYQIGDMVPSQLGGEIGTLLGTTNSFSERPVVVKELYWDQRLFEDRFRFAVGRIDPENLFGGHRLQSANMFFFNKAFSTNPTVAYGGPGGAVAAQVKPTPWMYVTAGLCDANGSATVGNLEGFIEDGEYLKFGELGFTPTIEGLGAGRYRVAIWHVDERDSIGRPSDEGWTISLDQDLGKQYIVFARYGQSDGDVTKVERSVQGGVGIKGVFAEEDMLGLAAAASEPADGDKRTEKVIEVFHRFQVTETTQFTVGVETIFDPSNAPDDDVLGVFSARLRVAF